MHRGLDGAVAGYGGLEDGDWDRDLVCDGVGLTLGGLTTGIIGVHYEDTGRLECWVCWTPAERTNSLHMGKPTIFTSDQESGCTATENS